MTMTSSVDTTATIALFQAERTRPCRASAWE
ncbi:Uncharacterised protein [Mycobacteroides abscessus]|nr:Uncharacterised protein [Mycobacteroides abscessus]